MHKKGLKQFVITGIPIYYVLLNVLLFLLSTVCFTYTSPACISEGVRMLLLWVQTYAYKSIDCKLQKNTLIKVLLT